jgi:hypothetical protein
MYEDHARFYLTDKVTTRYISQQIPYTIYKLFITHIPSNKRLTKDSDATPTRLVLL